jgi:catechol 2,3-dioxygenase-like lactoylglutathione lyase family enzyme
VSEPALVPELDVRDLDQSLGFYVGVVGFKVWFDRPDERFAYLTLGDVHLMLEEAEGPGRRFRTAPLDHPYGRGVNLLIKVSDSALIEERVRAAGFLPYLPLEERWYRQDRVEHGLRQFVVADPDGYLLRFSTYIGERPAHR